MSEFFKIFLNFHIFDRGGGSSDAILKRVVGGPYGTPGGPLIFSTFGNYDRPTDQPMDRKTDRLSHREGDYRRKEKERERERERGSRFLIFVFFVPQEQVCEEKISLS